MSTCVEILQKMIDACPVCRGSGEVKKWEAVDPVLKIPTGRYVGMKPCPYCKNARKLLKTL